MNLLKKKNTSLSDKLKVAVIDLSIDIFGYEKMISKNIISRTSFYANNLNIESDQLYLKILKEGDIVSAFLRDKQKALFLIPTADLKLFFLSPGEVHFMEDSDSINIGIGEYLNDFARRNKIEEGAVRFWINVKNNEIIIRAYKYQYFIQEISLKSLIKYFKK